MKNWFLHQSSSFLLSVRTSGFSHFTWIMFSLFTLGIGVEAWNNPYLLGVKIVTLRPERNMMQLFLFLPRHTVVVFTFQPKLFTWHLWTPHVGPPPHSNPKIFRPISLLPDDPITTVRLTQWENHEPPQRHLSFWGCKRRFLLSSSIKSGLHPKLSLLSLSLTLLLGMHSFFLAKTTL